LFSLHPVTRLAERTRSRVGFSAALLGGLCFPGLAFAQTCSITAFNGSYGAVDVLSGGADDSSNTFTISCTGTANQTVRLCIEMGPGNNPDASGNRVLTSGANTLRHEFYTSSARTTRWGSWGYNLTAYTPFPFGTTSDLNLGGSGSANRTFTVYTSVLANQQTKPPGTYNWNSGGTPLVSYGYQGGASCPTGGFNNSGGGSTYSATISANCNVSASNINFGSAGVLFTNKDASGTVTVQCTNTTPYSIGLSAGSAPGATVANRAMRSGGGAQVTYSLYTNSDRSTVWGNTVSTDTQSSTGTGSDQAFTVYGRVPPQTTPAPATYTDTITVTVTY